MGEVCLVGISRSAVVELAMVRVLRLVPLAWQWKYVVIIVGDVMIVCRAVGGHLLDVVGFNKFFTPYVYPNFLAQFFL